MTQYVKGDVVSVLEFEMNGAEVWRCGIVDEVKHKWNGTCYLVKIDDFVYNRSPSEIKVSMNSSTLDILVNL